MKRLEEAIHEYDVIVGILPTGYGKSKFLFHSRYLFNKLGKVIHVLPLRSIVAKLAEDIKDLGDVGYQAGILVECVDKTPFLTSKYTVVTFDSFLFNFYGIPVSEIFRSKWHSDVAFMISRCSHVILDEIHLVTTPDSISDVDVEFEKVINVIRDVIEWYARVGLKTIVFTASLYPWLIRYILPHRVGRVKIIVYAPEQHEYCREVKKNIKDMENVEVESFWSVDDDFYLKFKDYCKYVGTFLHFKELDEVLEEVVSSTRRRRIFVLFNSVKRCIEHFERYRTHLEKRGYSVAIIHGRMTSEARRKALNLVTREKSIVVFATQAIEAGVDVDFDILITEVAPPHSLIQRCGRVARYGLESGRYEIHVVLGGEQVKEAVERLCRGVYDTRVTLEVVRELLKDADIHEKMALININWRLPSEHILWDYLRLLCIPGEVKICELGHVKSFLNKLTHLRPRALKALKEIDERLSGSFIRASALLSVYTGPVDCQFKQEFLSKYTIPVSLEFIRNNARRVLRIENECVLMVITTNGYVVSKRGPKLAQLLKFPITSIYRTLSKIRKEYQEVPGETARVTFLGLQAKEHVFDEEWGYIKW